MRRSPLSHSLAVLRTTIGLTQKEMGDLVHRAARTIQSIELLKLPLTEQLALRIAEATGVDEAWLFEGNPHTPPRKGLPLIQAGRGEGEYTQADYEFYRAYVETRIWTEEAWAATQKKAEVKGNKAQVLQLALRKTEVFEKQRQLINLIDADLKSELGFILLKSAMTDDMRLVRWKIRRFLEGLAKEFSLEVPKTGVSIETLKLAVHDLSSPAEPAHPAGQPRRKHKP